jgi:hypothetical protein
MPLSLSTGVAAGDARNFISAVAAAAFLLSVDRSRRHCGEQAMKFHVFLPSPKLDSNVGTAPSNPGTNAVHAKRSQKS